MYNTAGETRVGWSLSRHSPMAGRSSVMRVAGKALIRSEDIGLVSGDILCADDTLLREAPGRHDTQLGDTATSHGLATTKFPRRDTA